MRLSLLIFVCAVLSSNALRAGTLIFGNYDDSTNAFSTGTGLNIGLSDAIPFVVQPSTPSGFGWAVTDVEFAAAVTDYNQDTGVSTHPVTVSLFGDSSNLPGTLLASVTLNINNNSPESQANLTSYPILLLPNQTYWIALSDVLNDLEWFASGSTGAASGVATFGDQGWTFSEGLPQSAVRVNATLEAITSPEPGTLLAFGSGLLLLVGKRLKK